jgi:hypothetical protein
MAEPHTSTVIAAAGGVSLVAGGVLVLGLPLPALVFGLAGGLIAVKLDTAPRTLWQRVTTVAMSTVCAATWAPITADMLRPADGHPGLWIAAVSITVGSGAELLLREALQAIVNRIRQLGGGRRDAS